MVDVDRLLSEATGELNRVVARMPVPESPRPRRTKPMKVFAAVATAVLAVTVIVISAPSADPPTTTQGVAQPATTTLAPTTTAGPVSGSGPVFGSLTGVVLLFDDGHSGLTALDLDEGIYAKSVVEGQRPGDEPFSMVRVGQHLVVGWGTPHAVDIVTRESTPIGNALIFIPGVDDDRVWLVDDPWNTPIVRQVSLDGTVVRDPIDIGIKAMPLIGISNGLALLTEEGTALWDATTGDIHHIGADPSSGLVIAVRDDELVWCEFACDELLVTNTRSFETARFVPPEGFSVFVPSYGFQMVEGFSPDGRYLAVVVGERESIEGTGLWILERQTGEVSVVADPDRPVRYLTWSRTGDQLFATSWNAESTSRTTIWRYHPETGAMASVVLPIGGLATPVAIDASDAGAYFSDGRFARPIHPPE